MTAARSTSGSDLAGLLENDEFGLADPLPLWTLPARLAGVVHGGVRAAVRGDVALLERLPVPPVAWPLVAVGIPVLAAVLHVVAPIGDPFNSNSPFVFSYADVYTESIPFMVIALLIGLLAPTLGVLFVLSFAVFDLIAAGLSPYELEPMHTAIAGRLVADWLLWLLAVEVPLLVRSAGLNVYEWRATPAGARVLAGAVAAAVSAAVLVWIWSQAVTYLVRPVFTWSSLFSPTYQAIATVQVTGVALAIIGGIAAAVTSGLRLSLAPRAGMPFFVEERRRRPELAIIGHLAASVLAVIALGGVISGTFDIALLLIALVAARPIASWGFSRIGGAELLARIPRIIRFVAGFAITYVIGLVVIPPLYDVYLFESEFLPLVITIAIGAVIFEFLLGEPSTRAVAAPGMRAAAGGSGVATLALALLAFGALYLALPSVALADNCSGRLDCNPSPWPAVGGAAGAGAAAGARRWGPKGPPPPPDKGPLDRAARAIGWISKTPGQKHLSVPMKGATALTSWQLDTAREISKSLGGDPPRDDFMEIAVAQPPSLPEMPTDGLPPRPAAALRELNAAQLDMIAYGQAAIISFDRYGGARRARDRRWAREQAAAVIRFKKQMGGAATAAADRMDTYLRSLREEGVADEAVTADEIRAYQARLQTQGFTQEEVAAARALGLTDEQIEASRQQQLAADPEMEAGSSQAYFTKVVAAYRELGETLSNLPDLPAERRAAA